MKHVFYTFVLVFFMAGCGNAPQPPIQLSDFSDEISVKKLGERLIDQPYGLNYIRTKSRRSSGNFYCRPWRRQRGL
jgi:hypothetical protein